MKPLEMRSPKPGSQSFKQATQVVNDVATFDAASKAIAEHIQCDGFIAATHCNEIIQEKVYISELVKHHFPGAVGSTEIVRKATAVTERLGLTDDNTLFAQSICPDEINHEPGDIPNQFSEYFGEVFHLGGLAGIPFTGKTGFGAFSHHVPDAGHAFVLMAPHIGLCDDNQLGRYSRDGQCSAGAACGAAVGAFNHCCANKPMPSRNIDDDEDDDFQMAYIIQKLYPRSSKIAAVEDPNARQALLAHETHDVAKKMLDKIVNVHYGTETSSLVVLTGVQINMPRPFEDFFQPLTFKAYYKDGSSVDLFAEAFLSST